MWSSQKDEYFTRLIKKKHIRFEGIYQNKNEIMCHTDFLTSQIKKVACFLV